MRPLFPDIQTRDRLLLRLARGPLGGLALVLLCCTVYLPGFFGIPPVDRDESRFAQASRQMFESVALPESQRDPELHSGGLAVPRVGGKDRLNKPPLIYWLQAGSAAVFTGGDPLADAIWMYRVPSFLAGIIIVLATWRLGCSMFDPRAGWLAGVLMAVSPVFVWEAHQARADMVMIAFTTLAMGQLWRLWRSCSLPRAPWGRAGEGVPSSSRSNRAPRFAPLLLWLFVTLGILTKGPITPMVVVLTALFLSVFSRNFRWLRTTRPLLGLAIVVAGVGPWVYAVAQQVGFAHYWSIIYDEVFGRAGSAKEGHWGPPGYHLVLLVVLFWPGSLLTGLSIARAWRRGFHMSPKRERRADGTDLSEGGEDTVEPTGRLRSRLCGLLLSAVSLRTTGRPEAFLLAWLLPSWIVFELVSTKLPHYTMPMYPAIALITARGLLSWPTHFQSSHKSARLGIWLWFALGIVLGGAVCFGWVMTIESPLAWISPIGFLVWIAATVRVWQGCRGLRLLAVQGWSVLAAVALLITFLVSVAPGLLGLSAFAHRAARAHAGEQPITWVGFQEDSIVWFARGKPSFTEPDELLSWFEEHPEGVAVVSVYAEESFRQHPLELDATDSIFGYHYTKGRLEKLTIVKRMPQ